MKLSQKKILINVLEESEDWLPGYKLMQCVTPWGWLGKEADRRLRELARDGLIEHRINNGYAEYRAKPRGWSLTQMVAMPVVDTAHYDPYKAEI